MSDGMGSSDGEVDSHGTELTDAGTAPDSKRSPDSQPSPGSESSSEEAIGRPAEWREGRYQQPGQRVDEAVVPVGNRDAAAPEVKSTPVTHNDYEDLKPPSDDGNRAATRR